MKPTMGHFQLFLVHGSLASERSERAQSCSCSIEISDTYVYIYMWRYIKLYAHARWYVMRAGLSVTTFISIVTTSNEH